MVVGSGGREHALVWKLLQGDQVETVFCAPGNVGCARMDGVTMVELTDFAELADFARENQVELTVVGPEIPLCAGIVDVFRQRGLRIFGPDQEAAQLEGSKAYSKDFMAKYDIPAAVSRSFDNATEAEAYVREVGAPIVIKADGLAAGKGVVVAMELDEALAAVADCFAGTFGQAGHRVLVEECLMGEEASILALTDGKTIVPLVSSQDHKRVGEGDTGANTGGMGAYSPAPVVTDALWQEIQTQVLDRFLAGCQAEGLDYRGVIYAGVMVTPQGPKVLEFNVRFGDPETQAILPRLESDLAEVMIAVADRRLSEVTLQWSEEPAVCVVMASGGYPGAYEKGHVISGLTEAAETGAVVFHAGTSMVQGQFVNTGGRVLGITARGTTIREAVDKAYRAADCITWQDAFYRRDIAHRALKTER
jgi:phosphoribosylamine--glycine ligase